MKRCVVSFANTPFYHEKMKRLQESVEAQGVKFIGYTSFDQIGCKPHSEVPYQFKPYAIQKAIEEGVTTLLWCDSPIVAIGDLTPVFEYIETHGYMFFNNYGHPLGKWTNDKMLNDWGVSREDAMSMKQIMACCMGFSITKNPLDKVTTALAIYHDDSDELFPGSWENHRHDQSEMSLIINDFGFNILEGHKTFFIYEHFKTVPEFQPISNSVCLISH